MRPKLTSIAIKNALTYSKLKKLVVIIDGLRFKANSEEESLRLETIKVAENEGWHDSRIEIWVYPDNLESNTDHIIRTHRRGLEISENSIWVEEDMKTDYEQFAPLVSNYWENSIPFVISGASGFNHINSKIDVRSALFSNFWLQSLNGAFLELVEKTFKDKVFKEILVRERVRKLFNGRAPNEVLYSKYLERFWLNKLASGLTSKFRWDSLAQYALISKNLSQLVSNQNLVEDLGFLSKHAMNFRKKPSPVEAHPYLPKNLNDEFEFCLDCEKGNSRVGRNISEVIFNSARYRAKKFFSIGD